MLKKLTGRRGSAGFWTQKRKGRMKRGRFQGKIRVVYIGTAILVAALNTAAWNSTAFSDWYIAHNFLQRTPRILP